MPQSQSPNSPAASKKEYRCSDAVRQGVKWSEVYSPRTGRSISAPRRNMILGRWPYLIRQRRIALHAGCIHFEQEYQGILSEHKIHHNRGDVREFSRRSRRRLAFAIAEVDASRYKPPFMISLTWHKPNPERDNRPFDILDRWIIRVRGYGKSFEYIWRMEFQKRGCPHFHIIVFPDKNADWSDIDGWWAFARSEWHRLAEPESRDHEFYGAHILAPRSYRACIRYIAKYIGKEPEIERPDIQGRRWGRSKLLRSSPLLVGALPLDVWFKLRRFCRRWLRAQDRKSLFCRKYGQNQCAMSIMIPMEVIVRLLVKVCWLENSGGDADMMDAIYLLYCEREKYDIDLLNSMPAQKTVVLQSSLPV